jgi:tRNA G18 (ribose-2'-O)-methylase SpoU
MRKLLMNELNRKSAEECKVALKTPVIAVLDNVRSMHNVGSVFRTADAFLIEAVYLCGYTPQPPHRDIQKTALGATETVHWKYYHTTMEAIQALKAMGYVRCAVEQVEGSILLDKISTCQLLDDKNKVAVIFGNEVSGVDADALKLCDGCIEIPQMGMKHSLNIAVAAGIVLWELTKYLKFEID